MTCTRETPGNRYSDDTGPGEDVTIEHRGAANAAAALDWAVEEFEAPESIFVTGCSAGSYGSILWLNEIARLFSDASINQLGDSGAGITTESFASTGIARWNIDGTLARIPDLGDLGDPLPTDLLQRVYRAVGRSFPEMTVSQYNTLFDGVQIFFYRQMGGGDPILWSGKMLDSLDAISEVTANFTSYTAFYDFDPDAGTPHCIITKDRLYTLETEGVKFLDWIGDLVQSEVADRVAPLSAEPRLSMPPDLPRSLLPKTEESLDEAVALLAHLEQEWVGANRVHLLNSLCAEAFAAAVDWGRPWTMSRGNSSGHTRQSVF